MNRPSRNLWSDHPVMLLSIEPSFFTTGSTQGLDLASFPPRWYALPGSSALVAHTCQGFQACSPVTAPSGHHHTLIQNHTTASHTSLLIFLFLPSSPPAFSAAKTPAYLQGTVSGQLLPESAPHPPQVEPVTSSWELFSDFLPLLCYFSTCRVISLVHLYMLRVLPGRKCPNTLYWAVKVNMDLGNFLTSPVKSSAF